MTAEANAPARRRRYERVPGSMAALTPAKLEALRWLAEMRFLSLPQIARLCCPVEHQNGGGRQDLAEKRARRHMRALFDAGLADVIPVSRAALAPPGSSNDASLLYGSAPNVYALTKAGLTLLRRAGLVGEDEMKRPAPAYGPRNGPFLAHELGVRDVRVWLEAAARGHGHAVETWRNGEEAAIDLGRDRTPRSVRPDAWFAYRLGGAVLVGLVEVDRGTERGDRRWGEKLAAYAALFASQKALQAATGYVNARVLVLCPSERRRDTLAALIGQMTDPTLAERFWLADHAPTTDVDIFLPKWRRLSDPGLHPLLPGGF